MRPSQLSTYIVLFTTIGLAGCGLLQFGTPEGILDAASSPIQDSGMDPAKDSATSDAGQADAGPLACSTPIALWESAKDLSPAWTRSIGTCWTVPAVGSPNWRATAYPNVANNGYCKLDSALISINPNMASSQIILTVQYTLKGSPATLPTRVEAHVIELMTGNEFSVPLEGVVRTLEVRFARPKNNLIQLRLDLQIIGKYTPPTENNIMWSIEKIELRPACETEMTP
jgi:hypothetical protein